MTGNPHSSSAACLASEEAGQAIVHSACARHSTDPNMMWRIDPPGRNAWRLLASSA